MIRTLIVDDEALALRRLKIMLNRYHDVEIVGQCRDGDATLIDLREKKPDLVFLDINMPGLNGLSAAEAAANQGVYVIFVTAFHQYAVQAFERNAVDYLLKPVSIDRLDLALDRFRQRRSEREATDKVDELNSVIAQLRSSSSTGQRDNEAKFYWMKDNRFSRKICLSDIEWIEAARDYVSLHMQSGKTYFTRSTMTNFESLLDKDIFLRVHRSSIINLTQVTKVSHKDGIFKLYLRSGGHTRVGRAYKSNTVLKLQSLASTVWQH